MLVLKNEELKYAAMIVAAGFPVRLQYKPSTLGSNVSETAQGEHEACRVQKVELTLRPWHTVLTWLLKQASIIPSNKQMVFLA